ncbi:MAG: class III signal peptide-containing protein [Methanobrevibacter sp.]|uniref:class III signal peptide-containing protein n=1 Tax=Methanobrevibacter sp. TaxID=66852 RepID=UPI0025F738FC|nr:class III signal peptide-containing protein [Methanobrevibacter sp.]MBQ6099947.1 class III signal peptide-containing protein [Methanobrevibacter sp.]
MIEDSTGQISLEYLLIFSISLIILVVFTMPLLHESMDNTFDVSDSIKTKADLSKMVQAIKQVYGQGQGSKQTVKLDVDKPVKITVSNKYASSKIKLKSGDNKNIKINVKSSLKTDSFNLKKGYYTFVVEWPMNSENMIIYQK